MSQLTDAMNAAIANLKATQTGVTADQVTTIVTQANAPLIAQLTTAVNSEKDDASKIADVQAALTEFTTAFAPTANTGSVQAGQPDTASTNVTGATTSTTTTPVASSPAPATTQAPSA